MDLDIKTVSPISCRVYPVVIFNILDQYIRRNEGRRVIGTLTGHLSEGIIEIHNCFPVPHTEGEQVGVDMEFLHNMLDLHHKVSPKEAIVGWFSTGNEINETSAMIHDFYGKEISHPPIHLVVDTNLTNYTLSVKAFISNNITFNEKPLGSQFIPISLEIQSFDEEKIGVDLLSQSKDSESPTSLQSDLGGIETSVKKLDEMLTQTLEYVNKVVEGKVEGDKEVGRFLTDSVAAMPKIDPATLDKMFSSSLQDLLLVVYLANLTRTQLVLAEKLQQGA